MTGRNKCLPPDSNVVSTPMAILSHLPIVAIVYKPARLGFVNEETAVLSIPLLPQTKDDLGHLCLCAWSTIGFSLNSKYMNAEICRLITVLTCSLFGVMSTPVQSRKTNFKLFGPKCCCHGGKNGLGHRIMPAASKVPSDLPALKQSAALLTQVTTPSVKRAWQTHRTREFCDQVMQNMPRDRKHILVFSDVKLEEPDANLWATYALLSLSVRSVLSL